MSLCLKVIGFVSLLSPFASACAEPDYTSIARSSTIAAISAGTAVGPVFHGFRYKSALQRSETFSSSYMSSLPMWKSVGPTVGFTVGFQNFCSDVSAGFLRSTSLRPQYIDPVSCVLAATASAIPYAIFNGQSLGLSAFESVRRMKAAQAACVVGRETAFFGALVASKPMADSMKSRLGDHAWVENSSYFVMGLAGSLAGHPCDTALTWSQMGSTAREQVVRYGMKSLMRGAVPRAVATGLFNCGYQNMKKACHAGYQSFSTPSQAS